MNRRRTWFAIALFAALTLYWMDNGPALADGPVTIIAPITPGTLFNPCTEEFVALTGETRTTIFDNGTHLLIHTLSHATGVGLSSGTQYQYQQEQTDSVSYPVNGALSATTHHMMINNSQGELQNFFFRLSTHLTLSPSGNVATHTVSGEGCRG